MTSHSHDGISSQGRELYLVYVFHPVLAILHLQPPWAHLWISDTLTLQALLTNGGEILG